MTERAVLKGAPIDVGGIVEALQQAFYDDPVMAYLFPAERSRRWRLAKLFQTLIVAHYLPLDSIWTTSDHAGAALWAPPGHWSLPPSKIARQAAPMLRAFGRHTGRALRALSITEKVHPTEPHWYLAVLGTAPRHQSQGVGSAVLAPVLERCDTEGLPAYLESSKERNIPFYRRHGFEVTGEMHLPDGPLIWPMWRTPRG